MCAQSCWTLQDSMVCNLPGSSTMRFPRQKYWNGLPFPSPWDLCDPGIEPVSPALQAVSLPLSYLGSQNIPHSFFFKKTKNKKNPPENNVILSHK